MLPLDCEPPPQPHTSCKASIGIRTGSLLLLFMAASFQEWLSHAFINDGKCNSRAYYFKCGLSPTRRVTPPSVGVYPDPVGEGGDFFSIFFATALDNQLPL
jgi:hypothetical protein